MQMSNVRQDWIARFLNAHDLGEDHQLLCLIEEVGELAEAYATDADDDKIAEELADILFVARTLAEVRDINITGVLNETALENLNKDADIDGAKVTKSGSEKPSLRPASAVLEQYDMDTEEHYD